MKKWEVTVLDIKGNDVNEGVSLSVLCEQGWRLISVVSLPLCRRAYLEREIPELEKNPPTIGIDKNVVPRVHTGHPV